MTDEPCVEKDTLKLPADPLSETVAQARTLADYRPQHDPDCESHNCAHCGNRTEKTEHWSDTWPYCMCFPPLQPKRPKPCTCGLDQLIAAVLHERPERAELSTVHRIMQRVCEVSNEPPSDDTLTIHHDTLQRILFDEIEEVAVLHAQQEKNK